MARFYWVFSNYLACCVPKKRGFQTRVAKNGRKYLFGSPEKSVFKKNHTSFKPQLKPKGARGNTVKKIRPTL
jgi:hypothetical protein